MCGLMVSEDGLGRAKQPRLNSQVGSNYAENFNTVSHFRVVTMTYDAHSIFAQIQQMPV